MEQRQPRHMEPVENKRRSIYPNRGDILRLGGDDVAFIGYVDHPDRPTCASIVYIPRLTGARVPMLDCIYAQRIGKLPLSKYLYYHYLEIQQYEFSKAQGSHFTYR